MRESILYYLNTIACSTVKWVNITRMIKLVVMKVHQQNIRLMLKNCERLDMTLPCLVNISIFFINSFDSFLKLTRLNSILKVSGIRDKLLPLISRTVAGLTMHLHMRLFLMILGLTNQDQRLLIFITVCNL